MVRAFLHRNDGPHALHARNMTRSWQPPPDAPVRYDVDFPRLLPQHECTVPGCPYATKTRTLLRRHFCFRHPRYIIAIRQECPDPSPAADDVIYFCPARHSTTATIRRESVKRGLVANNNDKPRKLQTSHGNCQTRNARTVNFTASGELPTRMGGRYLGRPISATDSDWPALHWNLKKAVASWARLSLALVREGAVSMVTGKLYKAVIQSVLLYGSETWTVTPAMLRTLEGLHHRVVRWITGAVAYRVNDEWIYLPIAGALEEAGLFPIATYLERRQNRIAEKIAARPRTLHSSGRTRWLPPIKMVEPTTPHASREPRGAPPRRRRALNGRRRRSGLMTIGI